MDECSFCGKSEDFGVRLVRGPDVAICDECVKWAHDEALPSLPEPERRTIRGERHAVVLFAESEVGGIRSSGKE